MRVQPRRDLASDGLQNPLKVNGSQRWLPGRCPGHVVLALLELRDPRNDGRSCAVANVREDTGRDDAENHLELEQLVRSGQAGPMFEAADLTVAAIAEEMGQVLLAQARSPPQQSNVGWFSVSLRVHTFRQPSIFFFIVSGAHCVRQDDRCADMELSVG
jgi:hypothetical protein